MKELLPFIVSGIATGAIFGLAGSGLVLTYKTTGVFNFGYGALATAAAYVFYGLYVENEVDWKIAFFISVFIVGPLLGLVMEIISRRLSHQRTAWKVVGTIGIVLLVQGLGTIKYGVDPIPVPQYLPKGNDAFRIFETNVGYDQLIVAIISVIAVIALYILFRFTRIGLSMRAVVDDPDLLNIEGTNPSRVRRIASIVGSTFAALSGVLIVPFIGLEPIALTFLVVQAFGAAAVGYFSNIPLTYIGGLAIGVLASVSTKYVLDYDWLAGVPASLPFIVLFVALLVTPRRKLAPPSTVVTRPHLQYRGPPELRIAVGIVVVALLALVPQVVGSKLSEWTNGLTQVLILLALGLLVRTAGLVSLCSVAFAAIGATAFSQFAVDHGMPWLVALLLGALMAVPVGALIAIPAIRLSGLFLALATLGFGIMIERLFYPRSIMFTPLTQGRTMPRPSFATTGEAYYYVVLAFVVVGALVMVAIHESRLGRVLRGMGEAPVAVSTLGLSSNTTRVLVFCIAAFFAAIGGVLYGGLVSFAVSSDRYYQSFSSLILLAVLALAPFREPWYALFGGITAVIPAYIGGTNTTYWLNVIFGFFAIVIALQGGPHPMAPALQRFFNRFGRQHEAATTVAVDPAKAAELLHRPPPDTAQGAPGLVVNNVTVRFGGLIATNDVTFEAPMGRITGLIGPNGAGKTTTFNACSGLNRPSSGQVLLHGRDISRLSPAARARRGLGRTFQIMELGDSLTVFENVALGREASMAGANPVSQIFSRPHEAEVRRVAASEALAVCGISELAGIQAGNLSTGQRRLVELARCLAGPFDLLLLDEPSSGLDRSETAQFGDVLRQVVEARGCGILLVEHDMSLVMRICDYIYVLDFGVMIFDGDPAAVGASEVVQAAYLGSEAVSSPELREAERALHAEEESGDTVETTP